MPHFPQPQLSTRAPRVNLRGRISAIIQLENGRQVQAKLHQLSVTGGLLELPAYLDERCKVDLTIAVGLSIVRPQAQMLFPMCVKMCGAHGYLQPFRFTRLWAEERHMLDLEITQLLKQTMARSIAGLPSGPVPSRFKLEPL
ncbi:MAG TPA: hypothetical protein VGM18_09360 [Candidatus Sulfotelmatobacter sp.]|jgi:hypothetical protein